MPRRAGAAVLAVLLGAGFLAGLLRILASRLGTGDVFPEYSSLRSDPLGTRVLYEALARLPGIDVRRGYAPLPADARDSAAIAAGCAAAAWQFPAEEDVREIEAFLGSGGRLVVTFAPLAEDPGFERALAEHPRTKAKTGPDRGRPEERTPEAPSAVDLRARWGVAFRYEPLEKDADGIVPAVVSRVAADAALPRALSWRSGMLFEHLGPLWSVLYARGEHPVLIERRWGRGTLVLASDSYFLSNEAQRADRHPDLLAALLGPARTILFDETHLGVSESPGVMTLLLRYRLGGLLLSLLVLAGLFLWRSASTFLPREEETPESAVSGRGAASGLANLLRRGIPPARLLSTCVEESELGAGPGARSHEARAAAAAASRGEKEILSAYRRIAALKTTTKGAA